MIQKKRRFKKLPCHNKMAFEIIQMLQVFGPLSLVSLYKRCNQIAEENGLTLGYSYFSEFLIQELIKKRYISLKGEIAAGYIERGSQRSMQDAFWVFLEFMNGMDMETIEYGPAPAKVSFVRNNNIYYIIRCDGDGSGMQIEIKKLIDGLKEFHNPDAAVAVSEKFIFIYSSQSLMKASPLSTAALRVPILNVVVEYPNADPNAKLFFSQN